VKFYVTDGEIMNGPTLKGLRIDEYSLDKASYSTPESIVAKFHDLPFWGVLEFRQQGKGNVLLNVYAVQTLVDLTLPIGKGGV
jgi:hypothetical protein